MDVMDNYTSSHPMKGYTTEEFMSLREITPTEFKHSEKFQEQPATHKEHFKFLFQKHKGKMDGPQN